MATKKRKNASDGTETKTTRSAKNQQRSKSTTSRTDAANRASKGDVKASSALLNAAANISFPVSAGYPINLGRPVGDGVTIRAASDPKMTIPGIIRFGYISTFGPLQDWTSPANVWIRDWYTFIRHINSGHTNYDATGLGYYGLSMRSCADFLTWSQRIYGVTKGSYVPTNQYTPACLVEACGADYADIVKHMADLRFYIASFAARLNIMKVPNFKFFSEGHELLNNIYADADMAKASFYVFAPDGFWTLNTGTTPEDTYMKVKPVHPLMKFDDIVELGEELLNAVLNSEDFNIMSGDIVKAYTDLWSPTVIDEDFTISPVYDEGVLWQIHNASYINEVASVSDDMLENWKIKQDLTEGSERVGAMYMDAPIYFTNATSSNWSDGIKASLAMNRVIDLPTEPTPAMVGAASRFMIIAESSIEHEGESNQRPRLDIVSCQTEIITSAEMTIDRVGTTAQLTYANYGKVSRFDFAPYICAAQGYYNPTTHMTVLDAVGMPELFVGEVTNPSVLTREVKYNIDMAVMLDKFGG